MLVSKHVVFKKKENKKIVYLPLWIKTWVSFSLGFGKSGSQFWYLMNTLDGTFTHDGGSLDPPWLEFTKKKKCDLNDETCVDKIDLLPRLRMFITDWFMQYQGQYPNLGGN